MRNAVLVLALAVLAVVAVPAGGWARELSVEILAPEAPTPVCSLEWRRVDQSMHGWILLGHTISKSAEGAVYQVKVLREPAATVSSDPREVILIAEWGDPYSKKLGNVIYCICLGDGGAILEEVGENLLEKITPVSAKKITL